METPAGTADAQGYLRKCEGVKGRGAPYHFEESPNRTLRAGLLARRPGARGLVRAILVYLRQAEDQNEPSWDVENLLPEEPPSSIRTLAHRIAQEGISNVRKHSRARHASIRFEPSEDGVLVTIRDDGVGFDPSAPDAIPLGHLGLTAMCERADAAGGLCEIDSLPGRGTMVRFWLPM